MKNNDTRNTASISVYSLKLGILRREVDYAVLQKNDRANPNFTIGSIINNISFMGDTAIGFIDFNISMIFDDLPAKSYISSYLIHLTSSQKLSDEDWRYHIKFYGENTAWPRFTDLFLILNNQFMDRFPALPPVPPDTKFRVEADAQTP